MRSWTQLELAWELDRAGVKVAVIAQRVGKHRATAYRWLKGMRSVGLREFIGEYKEAKKRPRRRKVNAYVERRILSIRREHRDCCGEKIVYWLNKERIGLSRSTVYRVLNRHLRLRPKGRRNRVRGPVPRAKAPREVMQMDNRGLWRAFRLHGDRQIYSRGSGGTTSGLNRSPWTPGAGGSDVLFRLL